MDCNEFARCVRTKALLTTKVHQPQFMQPDELNMIKFSSTYRLTANFICGEVHKMLVFIAHTLILESQINSRRIFSHFLVASHTRITQRNDFL